MRASTLCGTPEYAAPEMVKGLGYGPGADFWALGVLLHRLLVGVLPFLAPSVQEASTRRPDTTHSSHPPSPRRLHTKQAPPRTSSAAPLLGGLQSCPLLPDPCARIGEPRRQGGRSTTQFGHELQRNRHGANNPPPLWEVAAKLLTRHPQRRLATLEELKTRYWFESMDWEASRL